METFAARLDRLIKARGLSANQFAREVDKSSGYLSMVLSGQRLPDGNLKTRDAELWADVLGVTVQELTGIDRPTRIHRLSDQELYERFGIKPYDEPMTADGIYLSAGRGKGVPQGIDDSITRKIKGRRYLWEAPVVGDCMLDDIKPGELVIYNTRLSVEIGRIVVALRDEEELLIKRLALDGEFQVLRPNRGVDILVDERIRFLGRGVAVQRPL
jgi:transcriptional regulator with XRE-family HTH domain